MDTRCSCSRLWSQFNLNLKHTSLHSTAAATVTAICQSGSLSVCQSIRILVRLLQLTSLSSNMGLSLESRLLSNFESAFIPPRIHSFFQSLSVSIDFWSVIKERSREQKREWDRETCTNCIKGHFGQSSAFQLEFRIEIERNQQMQRAFLLLLPCFCSFPAPNLIVSNC